MWARRLHAGPAFAAAEHMRFATVLVVTCSACSGLVSELPPAPTPSKADDAGSISSDASSDLADASTFDAGDQTIRDAGPGLDAGAFDAGVGDSGVVVGFDAGAVGTISIFFPPPSATPLTQLTVRVRAFGAGVTAARIAGLDAQSTDGFSTFSAVVSLASGPNHLAVDVEHNGAWSNAVTSVDVTRTASEAATTRGQGDWGVRILGATWERVSQRVVLTDDNGDGAQTVDSSGARVTFSDSENQPNIGSGYAIVQPREVAASPTRVWTVDGDKLVEILFSNGDRSVVFTAPDAMSSVQLEAPTTALVLCPTLEEVLRVDLAAHTSTIVASAAVGGGTSLRNVGLLSLAAAGRYALLSFRYQDTLVKLDLSTGQRTVFSQAQGSEPRFSDPEHLAIDEQLNRAFVWDSNRLTAVDLTTGRRTLLNGAGWAALDSVYAMALTDRGIAVLDYIPSWEGVPRAPTLIAIDPVDGTRVVMAR